MLGWPFATVLGQKTSGKGFVSYQFDHWQNMPSDPMTPGPEGSGEERALTTGSSAATMELSV